MATLLAVVFWHFKRFTGTFKTTLLRQFVLQFVGCSSIMHFEGAFNDYERRLFDTAVGGPRPDSFAALLAATFWLLQGPGDLGPYLAKLLAVRRVEAVYRCAHVLRSAGN